MTANDPGHINKLDESQKDALKKCWIALIEGICDEFHVPFDELIGSDYGDELFDAVADDNPDVVVLRWLRSSKWDVNNAVDRLIDTLKWRHEFDVKQLLADGEKRLNGQEMKSGKTYMMGFDKAGRPVTYVHVNRHIRGEFPNEDTESLTILTVEIGRRLLRFPVETATVVLDLSGFSMKNMDYQLVRFFLNLLENHYPESLGMALVINVPLIFHSCWNVIKHWLDPVVAKKIIFLKNQSELSKYISTSEIPKQFGGMHDDFQYTPSTSDEQIQLVTLQQDQTGLNRRRTNHRLAAKEFLRLTLELAQEKDNKEFFNEQRMEATKKLQKSYKQLIPYLIAPTHYHRECGIDQKIFRKAYEEIQLRNNEKIVLF